MNINLRKIARLLFPRPKPKFPISATEARNKTLGIEARNKGNSKLEEKIK